MIPAHRELLSLSLFGLVLPAAAGAAGFLRSFALEPLCATGADSFAPFRVKED